MSLRLRGSDSNTALLSLSSFTGIKLFMPNNSSSSKKSFALIAAIVGWLAVGGQLYLIIENRTTSLTDTLIRFISFFTILSNILTAICFTTIARKQHNKSSFFSKPSTLFGVTINMLIVGITYNLILRFTWEPQGLQRIVDELLHVIMPVAMFIYWWLFVRKENVKQGVVLSWLLYPLVYLIYILIRGELSGQYPYPFINVAEIGYGKVIVNSVFIMMAFIIITFLLLWMNKVARRNNEAIA